MRHEISDCSVGGLDGYALLLHSPIEVEVEVESSLNSGTLFSLNKIYAQSSYFSTYVKHLDPILYISVHRPPELTTKQMFCTRQSGIANNASHLFLSDCWGILCHSNFPHA